MIFLFSFLFFSFLFFSFLFFSFLFFSFLFFSFLFFSFLFFSFLSGIFIRNTEWNQKRKVNLTCYLFEKQKQLQTYKIMTLNQLYTSATELKF